MDTNIVSINKGYEILNKKENTFILNEIIRVIDNTPLPIFKNKSKKQPHIDVVQQILNTYIKRELEILKWESEVDATPKNFKDDLKSDFRKTFINKNNKSLTIQIEVEFGNAASFYRDITKIQASHKFNMADIGVIILPTQSLSKRIDTGLANIEKAKREQHILESIATIPLLIIGIDDTNKKEWNVKDITNDLEIVKGSKNQYKDKHNALIDCYINAKKIEI